MCATSIVTPRIDLSPRNYYRTRRAIRTTYVLIASRVNCRTNLLTYPRGLETIGSQLCGIRTTRREVNRANPGRGYRVGRTNTKPALPPLSHPQALAPSSPSHHLPVPAPRNIGQPLPVWVVVWPSLAPYLGLVAPLGDAGLTNWDGIHGHTYRPPCQVGYIAHRLSFPGHSASRLPSELIAINPGWKFAM